MHGGGRWRRETEEVVVELLRLISAALLSLLLPLSFLLLSRLSSARFLFSFATLSSLQLPPQTATSFFLSVYIYAQPVILYGFVSFISVCTLIHGLTTKITADSDRLSIVFFPRISCAWLTLVLLQVTVGLGFEGTVTDGVTGIIIGKERNILSRIVFFLGLHEVMLQWWRVIVRPVVDDTLIGEGYRQRKETVVERVALAVSCGTLWWWKLRDEVESLVGVAEAKRDLILLLLGNGTANSTESAIDPKTVDVGFVDFLNWWLYYLVVTIGMIRVVKGIMWVAMILLFKRVRRDNQDDDQIVESLNQSGWEDDDKV